MILKSILFVESWLYSVRIFFFDRLFLPPLTNKKPTKIESHLISERILLRKNILYFFSWSLLLENPVKVYLFFFLKISCIFLKKEYNSDTTTYGYGIFIFYRLQQWQKKQIVHATVETPALADLAAHVHTAKQKILKLALAISSSNYRLSLTS